MMYIFKRYANIVKICMFRRSRLEVLCRKGVLRNFAKFTGKLFQPLSRYGEHFIQTRTQSKIFTCDLSLNTEVLFTHLHKFPINKFGTTNIKNFLKNSSKRN